MPEHDDIRGQLREDHQVYLAELDSLRRESDAHRSHARLSNLRRSWAVHSLAEESVVYRALESTESAMHLADERFIEHELIEELFEKLARCRPGTLEWQARIKVTRDIVARHIASEEQDVFSRLERQFDGGRLAAMAVEFARERDRLEHLEEAKAAA